jgi:hypothetical protein
MSKKSLSNDVGDSTETTEATLTALTSQINQFVREGTLDSRCAAKLGKRLKKESDAISESGKTTVEGQKALQAAFDALEEALRDHDARLLVAANAALRAADDVEGAGESQ